MALGLSNFRPIIEWPTRPNPQLPSADSYHWNVGHGKRSSGLAADDGQVVTPADDRGLRGVEQAVEAA